LKEKLHIISLENPFPADYGGVMGIFNRIKALHESGLEIHLHVFYHEREPRRELELFCYKVYYYKRDMRKSLLFSKFPFIVASRSSKKLLDNLKSIEAPILFEGLHVCFYLLHKDLSKRIRLVRTHNIEHEYYHHLSLTERSVFKRWYLKRESKKLEQFESVLKDCNQILSVVESDQDYFKNKYGHSELMPVFIDESKFRYSNTQKKTVLYHGNLSVSENSIAAEWLIENVFSKLKQECIIAGKNPSTYLINQSKAFKNIRIIANPSFENLNELIQESAVCVLPTFQGTGIKLKLIDSLMQGKHCVVNSIMLTGTSLGNYCHIAESPDEFLFKINKLSEINFTEEDFEKRKTHLKSYFNNQKSVQRIKELIKVLVD
jgi:hypothetical protein